MNTRSIVRVGGSGARRGGWRLIVAGLLAILAGAADSAAQQKRLTLDAIYNPAVRVAFSGQPTSEIMWLDDARYRRAQPVEGGVAWVAVDAATGAEQPLLDADRMEAALARVDGIGPDAARRAARSRGMRFNHGATAVLVDVDNDLFLYVPGAGRAERLTRDRDEEELPSFSPDDRRVAFVRGNNLFAIELSGKRERKLTSDGSGKILNGVLDWVYEEEIYGRGARQAYWWSPDSNHLAFLRLDDTPVPTYLTVDDIPYDQEVERWDYPKAGDRNPVVTLGVAAAGSGKVQWVDVSRYPAEDRLIVNVGWTPDSRQVLFSAQNRIQTWLELNRAGVAAGEAKAPRTLVRETSQAWIDPSDMEPPTWLADGTFLWISARTGWRHAFRYDADGRLLGPVTSGKWELRVLHGVDRADQWVYFSGTERSHIGSDVYRVRLDGTGLTRLSAAAGSHTARFSPGFSFFADTWSDVTTPSQLRLHRNDGSETRVIDANPVPALAEYRLATPEFLQVPTRDGFVMEAMIIKPPDFDPSRRYPVYQFTYGGPHSPQVRNGWGGSQYMFHQLLAQEGVIVWICDNRTASGKGAESAWPVYRNFGETELRDIEDGLTWLRRQPYVDAARIGIHGWSYGGYMTSYALTHSTSFVMGIAGGTVSDWRGYDTVYTERFMGTPDDNPEGYRRSSPRWAANDLHGSLLLIHGAIDDNVHVSNTMQFAYELQKANKPFRLMLYPRARHGVVDPAQVHHLRSMMFAFVLEHLTPGTPPGRATGTR
jgi:dipeptidyl-peptidase-4